jgi:hypothetical protein
MVLASDNLTYQPPPYSSITRDYDRNRSITLRLVIRRPVLTHNTPSICDGAYGYGPCRQESRISTR